MAKDSYLQRSNNNQTRFYFGFEPSNEHQVKIIPICLLVLLFEDIFFLFLPKNKEIHRAIAAGGFFCGRRLPNEF